MVRTSKDCQPLGEGQRPGQEVVWAQKPGDPGILKPRGAWGDSAGGKNHPDACKGGNMHPNDSQGDRSRNYLVYHQESLSPSLLAGPEEPLFFP